MMKKIVNIIMLENNEKLKQLLQKTLLIIEFIVSIFMVYSLYRILIHKYVFETFTLKYLLIFIPTFIINVYLIIFNIKNNKEKVEKIFISFLIPISLSYVFFIIPTYIPDENAHVWKSYEISTGKLITSVQDDGTANSEVPEFFKAYHTDSISKYSKLESAKQVETDYNNLSLVDNPARAYPTILYAFSSIGFLIGRLINLNGIFAIYLARIFNTIIFLVLGYFSIKLIPFGKKVLGVILFLPMMLQQCISVSADSFMNCIIMFYIAYVLKICVCDKKINWKQIVLVIVMSVIIAISKFTYCPIIGICFLFISTKNMDKKKKKIIIPIIIIISAIATLGYYIFMQRYPSSDAQKVYFETNNVNQIEQIKYIINNPIGLLRVLKNSIISSEYLEQMIGIKLGWLNINIPSMYITIFLILLAISPFLDKNEIELKKWQKIWFLLISIVIYCLVIIALYLTWTPVGSAEVLGVQGRYFLPILPMILLPLCKKNRYIEFKNINVYLPIILSFINILVIKEVFIFFI